MQSNNTVIGLFGGLLSAISWSEGGFPGLIAALILGGGGYALGAWRDGNLDLGALRNNRSH